ncbi:MAG: penicillin-insensitive murein endopeptidase [Hyphomicrobium sp.]
MRRARFSGVIHWLILPALMLSAHAVRAEPPVAAEDAQGEGVPALWSNAASATAEAAAANAAAKAAAEARALATDAASKAKAAAEAAKAAAEKEMKATAAPLPAPPAPQPAPDPAAATQVSPVVAPVAPAAADLTVKTDATVRVADDDEDLKLGSPAIKPGSIQDKRPAKKLFGVVKTAAPLAARAIGGYAKGCLAGGKALPIDGPAWQAMRLSRNRNWAHPKLIKLLERFATEMQTQEKWPGLLIGDLAQPRGGPMLTGHKSHQLGLDADIWFKPMPTRRIPEAERETLQPLLLAKDNGTEVIAENFNEGFVRLVKRAANYSDVERIFVHPAIKKAFCAAAGTDRAWLRKVRPMWLHNYHFHVRMGCPADSPTCVPQKPIPAEDGCGKDLEDWLKLVSKPPKPAAPKPITPPVKPSKPAPPLMLKDLPPECTTVIAAADPKPAPAKAPAKPAAEKPASTKPADAAATTKSAQQKP